MANKYQKIDFESWKRKEYCNIYSRAAQPQFCISFNLDVTHFKAYVKEKKQSFSMAFIFAVTKCANEIEEFRYRFLEDEIVLYESIDVSFTYLNKETELFEIVNVAMQDTVEKFVQSVGASVESKKHSFADRIENDAYYFAALPWITFTGISPTDFVNCEKAQPKFVWGKYDEKDGQTIMPFAVQVHHAFVDGIHIGKLADNLQQYLNNM